MTLYNRIFSPVTINSMALKNRLVMPPMATYFADADGLVNDRHIAYYRERVEGGVGYITIESTCMHGSGRSSFKQILITSGRHVGAFRRLTDMVHEIGGKIVIQINHAGRSTSSRVTGKPLVGPSAVPDPVRQEIPHVLTVDEIKELVEAYARAASRVQDCGADGIEIHMAHGYLLNQFLSPLSNLRTDAYGGDLHRRLKMPLEVVQGVRQAVGEKYPIICRISADEYMQGGIGIEDSCRIAKFLADGGADAIHVSASHSSAEMPISPHYYMGDTPFIHLAQKIKAAVNVPVIAVGGVRTPETANEIVSAQEADLVAMGRALIADPHLPRKSRADCAKDIIPCIACNQCSFALRKFGYLRCAVNPEVGRENDGKVTIAEAKRKRVWVVGGGPAGMKAAQLLSIQGHKVRLYEKKTRLGGRILRAARPPGKQVYQELADYLIRQLAKLNVEIVTGRPFDPKLLSEKGPDALIIATGADNVLMTDCSAENIICGEQVLTGNKKLGRRILVLGGSSFGAEIADYLCSLQKEVTVVESKEDIALDLPSNIKKFLRRRLDQQGVHIRTGNRVISINENGVVVENAGGIEQLSGFDDIIAAIGFKSNDSLAERIKSKVDQLMVIGDAAEPREITDALSDALDVALAIND
jgi:2,4-dienoyl-CoA reductase-like NADH-dependent reductase (Old Yellow Enzyme family)/thioredoxin reductase